MKKSNPYKAVIPSVSGIAYVPNPRPHPEQPLEVTVRSERIGTLGRDLAPGVRLISQISQTEKEVWVTHGEERLFVLLQDGLGRSSYFYQSFSGTGGKAQGAWFPSGGILADRQGRGVWVIKGSPKTDPGAGRAALLELYEKANAVLPQSDADTDRFVKKLTGVGFDEDFTYKDAYEIKPVLRILEDGSARDLQTKWGSWAYQFWALNALDKTFGKRTFNMKTNPTMQPPHRIRLLLGTMPDRELGEMAGVSYATVRRWRQERDIPAFQFHRPYVMGALTAELQALLGTMPDSEIARKAGVSQGTVGYWREMRGIPAFPLEKCRPEVVPLLGTMPDKEIAEREGVGRSAVMRWRDARGIPPFRAHSPYVRDACTPEIEALLGTMPDSEVARIAGVHPGTVPDWRQKKGIPAFRRLTLTPEIEELLGKVPDKEISKRTGASNGTVYNWRAARGIPPFSAKNPEDLAGRHIPDRYLAGLPPALQKQRVRELTESRDAYKRGDYSELATDVTARKMGLVKESSYTTEAKKRGISYRGDFHDMAKRTLKFYSGRAPAREVEAFAEALRKSFSKGLAAWKSGGHRPGATAQNWAVARVNSLVVGGKTSWTADKKLFEVLPESVQAKVESMRAKSNPLTKAATRDYISQYRVEHSSTATAAELIARRSKSYSGGLIQTRGSAAARSPQTVQEMSAASALAQYAHLLKNLDDAEIEQLMKLEAKAEKEGALTPEDASKMSEIQNKIHEVWRRSTGRGRGAANEEKRAAELGIAMGPAEQRRAQEFYRDESAARSDILSLDAYMEQFGRKTEGVTPARIAAQMKMTLEKYNEMRALYQKYSYSQYETTPLAELGTTTQGESLAEEIKAQEQTRAAILAARGLLAAYPFVPGFPPKPEAKALDLIIQALREGRGLASDDSIERRSALTRADVGVLLAKVGQSARLLLEDPWEAAALEAELAALPVQGQKLISNRGRRG
jgi:transposase-like protein